MSKYIIGIDQSTQGTKALLFNEDGDLIGRDDMLHEQIVNDKGWVEHNPIEIYYNTLTVISNLIKKTGINKDDLCAVGISNQRETALVWDRETGEPIYNAIVWQCARGEEICHNLLNKGYGNKIKSSTGLQLSPYFSAAKIAWVLQNVEGAADKNEEGKLCMGTMDSWLIYKLTNCKEFRTDYSNASRTQMFNVSKLEWDKEICSMFGINTECLAKVCASDSMFGTTDLGGILDKEIEIHAVMGDSHGALFGQGCHKKGMIKATYGTGSSIMMNIGEKPVFSDKGVVTSLAWCIDGKVNYVLEGNINYTGAVISWIQNDLKLINSAKESQELAYMAHKQDKTYLVPAFSGLGAPYWDSDAAGIITGITRTTGRAEVVKAALDCIVYQITDIVKLMSDASETSIEELRVDGGPTRNEYLMQFQSDMLNIPVQVPDAEELSGIGAAYAAGIGLGIYDKDKIFSRMKRQCFKPSMLDEVRKEKYAGWKKAVESVLTK